jgi:hypothetical protein
MEVENGGGKWRWKWTVKVEGESCVIGHVAGRM